ncbi:MAG: glycosyltransferase family 87 protein [Vicinamibacterales bacterium]
MTSLRAYRPLVWPVAIALLAVVLYNSRVRHEMVDFEVYWTAAGRALHAQPLYQAGDGHYQFKYLPAFAVVLAPMAVLGHDTAQTLWFAMSVGLLMAFVRWSITGLPERRRSPRVLTWLTLLFMAKFYAHELMLGQANIFLGTLLVAALLAVQIDQPRAAGVLIGIAVFVKPYALVLLPWLAFSHGPVAALWSLGVIGTGLVLPASVYGWQGNLDQLTQWYQTVSLTTAPNLVGADNISLAAMWAKWLGVGRVASGLATVSAGAVLGLAAVVWRRRHDVGEPDYLEVALLMLLVPLLSPQGWDYVLLLATPAVICLVDRWSDVTPAWRAFTAVALALMGLTIFDLMGRALYAEFMALSIVTLCALGVAVALMRLRARALA